MILFSLSSSAAFQQSCLHVQNRAQPVYFSMYNKAINLQSPYDWPLYQAPSPG